MQFTVSPNRISCRELNCFGSVEKLKPTILSASTKLAYVNSKMVPSFPRFTARGARLGENKVVSTSVARSEEVRVASLSENVILSDAKTFHSVSNLVSISPKTPNAKNIIEEPLHLGDTVQALVLGGGAAPRGHSMEPLTRRRAKPAIPFGGRYRLIDIPLSNIIRSGLNRAFVITQYNSHSLNEHITKAFPTSALARNGPFIEVLATHQTNESKEWAKGSADAVRQWLSQLIYLSPDDSYPADSEDYLVLSGEHVYHMDYSPLIRQHRASGADVTVSCAPVGRHTPALAQVDGAGLGLVVIDPNNKDILHFREKPISVELPLFENMSLGAEPDKPFVASMGLYVFKADVLKDLLKNTALLDFGRDVLPYAIDTGMKVKGYVFDGYWEDVSTLRKFYEANLALARPGADFHLYSNANDSSDSNFTQSRMLPPTKLSGLCNIEGSLLADGCWVDNSTIRNSVLGMCTRINKGCLIEDSIIMGSETPGTAIERSSGEIPAGIGANCHIRNAVIDKHARIGEGVKILNKNGIVEGGSHDNRFCIRSGLVVVLKNAVLPKNMVI